MRCRSRLSHLSSMIAIFSHETPTTESYTLSLHDALPILSGYAGVSAIRKGALHVRLPFLSRAPRTTTSSRSEEHTSELQSQSNLVCRLLLEKKKKPVHDALRFDAFTPVDEYPELVVSVAG